HLSQTTGLPVTCSHELSNALGGPRRALTTVLNARLISLLDRLIKSTSLQIEKLGLNCSLMVVKGDGTLLQADYARTRPVETVLSGPAASISGAAFLVEEEDFIVSDIGGTTTDIARLRGGVVQTSADGAMVGGWRTNVEAAHIHTFGLGGDSMVSVNSRDLKGGICLGPRRAIPLSLLGTQQPQIKEILRQQTEQAIAQGTDGRFVQAMVQAEAVPKWLTRSETKLLYQLIEVGVTALSDIATTQVAMGAVERLITRGLVMLSCFTPTDAAHVLGQFDEFDMYSAELGAQLLARQKSGSGSQLAAEGLEAARIVIDTLTNDSAVALMDAALADD
ncbi:MAG: hydantoinase/oxoprolinase family protein, partial [Pseudomonadota bacterium]|nr:hydantoinase/oxoprolinase family protein [Pseudomonadota bacterium]